MRVGDLRAHEDVLGFRPEDAVRWLSPGELWRAGVKVVLSSVFASYADKREVQEALQPTPLAVRRAASGELWLDFVADLGDGFDATSTIAGLLAADTLEPGPPGDGQPVGPLPRASVLVLGGDEVYPTASAREYDNRMKVRQRSVRRRKVPPGAKGLSCRRHRRSSSASSSTRRRRFRARMVASRRGNVCGTSGDWGCTVVNANRPPGFNQRQTRDTSG